MRSSGFADAAISRLLSLSLVTSSILVSITDTRHIFPIQLASQLWHYSQLWRVLTWQLCFTNSTEVLFATVTMYHLRVIERLWGTRKFASFILSILPYTSLIPPLLLALVLNPLSFGRATYLPAGATSFIFALLAQYHAIVPHAYKYRMVGTEGPSSSTSHGTISFGDRDALTFTDKTTTYLLAGQLALSQLPGSALSAAVGWLIGYAWRNDVLPGASRWRIPQAKGRKERGRTHQQGNETNGPLQATMASGTENVGAIEPPQLSMRRNVA